MSVIPRLYDVFVAKLKKAQEPSPATPATFFSAYIMDSKSIIIYVDAVGLPRKAGSMTYEHS